MLSGSFKLKRGHMKKMNIYHAMIFLSLAAGTNSEIKSYQNNDIHKKLSDKAARSRNKAVHKMEDNIRDIRLNIEDYGATPATYEKLKEFDQEIQYLCIACPNQQHKKCLDSQTSLKKKLHKAERLAHRRKTKNLQN